MPIFNPAIVRWYTKRDKAERTKDQRGHLVSPFTRPRGRTTYPSTRVRSEKGSCGDTGCMACGDKYLRRPDTGVQHTGAFRCDKTSRTVKIWPFGIGWQHPTTYFEWCLTFVVMLDDGSSGVGYALDGRCCPTAEGHQVR